MPPTGFIDPIGIGVPDLTAAKRYYDELMPILGLRAWFPTTEAGEFNYGPVGGRGPQLFFYQGLEPAPASPPNPGNSPSTASTTPPTSLIPPASCSKSFATAPSRCDADAPARSRT